MESWDSVAVKQPLFLLVPGRIGEPSLGNRVAMYGLGYKDVKKIIVEIILHGSIRQGVEGAGGTLKAIHSAM